MHKDDQTVVKERIYLDKADKNVLHDEITTIDNALTRPWTVMQTYPARDPRGNLGRAIRALNSTAHVVIGNEHYFLSGERPADAGAKEPAAARPALFQYRRGRSRPAS